MIRPLFKAQEPFMEVRQGYGYQGIILYDDFENLIQCHICGKWKRHLGQHVLHAHFISADQYKMENGLTLRTALCVTDISAKRREIAFANIESLKKGWKNCRLGNRKHRKLPPFIHGRKTMTFKNSKGICQAQMAARYLIVKNIVKKEPSCADLEKYDSRLIGVIQRSHNGLNSWRRKNGFNEDKISKYWKCSELDIISALRKWTKENNRIPVTKDFIRAKNGYPGMKPIYNRFGSLSNALRISGIK